jgi:uncharacterized damage-inducible protein DinB
MPIDSQLQTLIQYHFATTRRLMEHAAKLDDAGYRAASGYGHGSIHTILFHVLQTDCSWRVALESGQQQSRMDEKNYPDLDSLSTGFRDEERAWLALLQQNNAQEFDDNVTLTSWRGDPWTFARWRPVMQIILHGMQHHAELAEMLTAAGHSPGNLDFIFFREG